MSQDQRVCIIAALRTPIGKFNGTLAAVPAHELGALVIRGLLEQTKTDPKRVNEVVLGQVLTAAQGMNPARQAALGAGLPYDTPCMTINKVCGSGLKAVQLAAQAILCNDAAVVIAGGQENMSLAPHALSNSRDGCKMGDWQLKDTMITDGLWDVFNNYHMGITAENIVERYDISRQEQDRFAAQSQQRAEAAIKAGTFHDEIIPVEIPQRKGEPIVFDTDEFPRHGVTAEKLSPLRPVFKKEGTVTAGNASGINDGAAAVLTASAAAANEMKAVPLAYIVAYGNAGVDPAVMGTGPIPAVRKCLDKAGWSVESLDLVEANEAFAAQAMCVNNELGLEPTKVNVNGGAIALGHPIGASGCRILVSLLHEMRRRDAKRGLATLCVGGGQGVALAVER